MEEKSLVKNAADKEQVDKAKKQNKYNRDTELDDIRVVMGTVNGRRFIWRLLNHCSAYSTIFSPTAMVMAYQSGKQDVGHYLQAEIGLASRKLYKQMEDEYYNSQEGN